jgi:alpha-N-arabinofuranosidase
MHYHNPILPGFYPDPSVCRVGEDYYLVNSSFEYFPGVPIFHSRDLVHWEQLGHVLTRPSQLPLEKSVPSDGIYAPTLRFHDGTFYLATTNNIAGKGFRNFYVTAENPAGPWSEPIWVKQGGIDPSLFFDDDGKAYWTGNGTGWAPVRGIYQSEINPRTGETVGEPKLIWTGTGGSYPEAPHLFKRGAYYYLTVAEGGTAEGHMVTIARARHPFGPFESCPRNPILSHRSLMSPIQGTGHADLFEDHRGQWWAVCLGLRYAHGTFQNLGRETFLAPVDWTEDGWPLVNGGERLLEQMTVNRPFTPHPMPLPPQRDSFEGPQLAPHWVFLRNPGEADWSLGARRGWLQLRCAQASLDDLASPAWVGRRQQHFEVHAGTLLDFCPTAENEEAGIGVLIDNHYHAELVVTQRDGRRVAFLRRRVGSICIDCDAVPLPAGEVELTIDADRHWYSFAVTAPGQPRRSLGRHEVRFVTTQIAGGYTGAFLGLFATARGRASRNLAHFAWFDYVPLKP